MPKEDEKPIIALDIGGGATDNQASSSTKILSTSKTSCQIHRRPKAPKEQARKGINKTTRLKMLFRSKTAIFVGFQKVFKAEESQ